MTSRAFFIGGINFISKTVGTLSNQISMPPKASRSKVGAGSSAQQITHVDASLIHEFRSVTGADAALAERALRLAKGNLESAIDRHFSIQQPSEPASTSLPSKRLTQPNLHEAKRARVACNVVRDEMDIGTSKDVLGEENIVGAKISVAEKLQSLNLPRRGAPDADGWQVSIPYADEPFMETNESTTEWASLTLNLNQSSEQFVDSAFPANASSIDGKGKRNNVNISTRKAHTEKDTKYSTPACHCNAPSVIKEVAKDGPNQGRYFYGCGGGEVNRFAKKIQQAPSPKKMCPYFKWADFAPSSEQARAMRWRRFTPPRFRLTSSASFKPSDVRQGAVGDCWLLSALAVVAEREDLVERLLLVSPNDGDGDATHSAISQVTHLSQHVGTHLVRLFLDGKWRGVVVDPFLPVRGLDTQVLQGANKAGSRKKTKDDDDFQPAYSRASKNQLWVPLLEKAHAKEHGSYHAISGGWICEGLFDLTGCPTEIIELRNASDSETSDSIWSKLVSYASSKFPMGCCTEWGDSQKGIVGGHAYSVMEVRELHNVVVGRQTTIGETTRIAKEKADGITEINSSNTATSERLRLLRVRNPWGRKEWSGEWGTGSEVWTRKLGNELGHVRVDDGTFWMSFSDFQSRFAQVDVCKAHKGWFVNSAELFGGFGEANRGTDTLAMHTDAFELEVSDSDDTDDSSLTWSYLMLLQRSKRGRRHGFWYQDLHVAVYEKQKADSTSVWQPVATVHGAKERDAFSEIMFEKNKRYLIKVFSFAKESNENKADPAVLRVYSARPVKIRPIPATTVLPSLAPAVHLGVMGQDSSTSSIRVCGGAVVLKRTRGGCFVYAVNTSKSELTLRLAVNTSKTDVEVFQHPAPEVVQEQSSFGKYVPYGEATGDDSKKKKLKWSTHSIPPNRQRLLAVAVANGPSESKTHGLNVRVCLVGTSCTSCASRPSKSNPSKATKATPSHPLAEFGLPPPPEGTTDDKLAAMLANAIAEVAARDIMDGDGASIRGDKLRLVSDTDEAVNSEKDEEEVQFVKEIVKGFGQKTQKKKSFAKAPPRKLLTLFAHVPLLNETTEFVCRQKVDSNGCDKCV